MYKIYFKQAIQLLKQNKFISIVSIMGTAMAIMMIMAIVVSDEIKTINIAPEINRERTLYVINECDRDTTRGSMQSGNLRYFLFKDYFEKLKAPESVGLIQAFFRGFSLSTVVNIEGSQDHMLSTVRGSNAKFWEIMSFTFLEGKPYNQEEYEAGMKHAVITKTLSQKLFKSNKATGRTISINFTPYQVIGVVEDVSPIFTVAYSDVWIPITSFDAGEEAGVMAILLAKDKKDFPAIIEEVRECEKKYSIDRAPWTVYYGGPLTHKEIGFGSWPNSKEELEESRAKKKRSYILIISILLLVPAINLSGFSLSRIKKRTAEIGIRKAFGAKKYIILIQVLYENMITSLIGGIIGLIASYAAIFFMKEWLLNVPPDSNIPVSALVSPSIFLAIFLICLIINIISAGWPAYRASRMTIVDSLTQNDK
jgi:putative ABC transport system permease protein